MNPGLQCGISAGQSAVAAALLVLILPPCACRRTTSAPASSVAAAVAPQISNHPLDLSSVRIRSQARQQLQSKT